MVCDEGHKIKTHSTNASKAMHRLGAAARYKMLLTGTPVTNKALDIFSQYKFLNDQIFGRSFYSFRNRYFDMVGYGQHTPVMKRSIADGSAPVPVANLIAVAVPPNLAAVVGAKALLPCARVLYERFAAVTALITGGMLSLVAPTIGLHGVRGNIQLVGNVGVAVPLAAQGTNLMFLSISHRPAPFRTKPSSSSGMMTANRFL